MALSIAIGLFFLGVFVTQSTQKSISSPTPNFLEYDFPIDDANDNSNDNLELQQFDPSQSVNLYVYRRLTLVPCSFNFSSESSDSDRCKRFNPSLPTKVLIHGWNDNLHAKMIQELKASFLAKGDCNVIAVDWGTAAHATIYFPAAKKVAKVGEYVAKCLDFLVENYALDLNSTHVLGFSLGAHVAGYVGKNLKSGRLPRITGLDPAGPYFTGKKSTKRLSEGDADFVDVIHTTAGLLGIMENIGDEDYYPNGGQFPQPICNKVLGIGCSHFSAVQYYLNSIHESTAYPSVECDKINEALTGDCTPSSLFQLLQQNVDVYMGENAVKIPGTTGIFYTETV